MRITQGSGKTFTMLGPEEVTSALVQGDGVESREVKSKAGIIPQTIYYLFEQVALGMRNSVEYNIKCSYLEIYNESINDLLSTPPAHNLKIREFPRLGMCVIGSVEKVVNTPEDVFGCLALGTMNRITCSTELNQRSSRSHTLFIVSVEQKMLSGSSKLSKINLVDLAGSEKVGKTGATGQALKEAQNINLSLTTLGRCIKALSSRKEEHIPFRESKLTLILKEALGGNAKTSLICTASQKIVHLEESKGTLKFAERAKKVQTKAKSNVKRSHEELLAVIDELNAEISTLRNQLKRRDGGESSDSRKGSVCMDDEIYMKYADLKAQYDTLVETSQFENEKLKAEVDQLGECKQRYAREIRGHMDKIEELNQTAAALLVEKERLERDLFDTQHNLEATTRELEVSRKERKGTSERLLESLREKDQELEQTLEQIKMYEDLIKKNSDKAASLKDSLGSKGAEIETLSRDMNELRARLTKVSENEIHLQSALTRVTREREEKDLQLVLAQRQIANLQGENKSLADQLTAAETQLAVLKETRQQEHLDHQMTAFTLNQQLEEAKRSVTAVSAAKHETGKAALHAKQMITVLMQEMADLRTMNQGAQLRYKQELLILKEKNDEKVRELEEKIAELTARLDEELTKNSELSKSLKLALVEEDSLKFYLAKMKGDIMNLTHDLNKEKELCQTFQNELREALATLDHYKKVESAESNGLEAEIEEARKEWKANERRYKSSIDDITAQLLRLTAENAALNDSLTAKETEVRGFMKRENALKTQVSVLTLKVEKLEYWLRFFKERNNSSMTPALASKFLTMSGLSKAKRLSFSSTSSPEAEKEVSPEALKPCWNLRHKELYGMQVDSLYANEEGSEGSVRCKDSPEASSGEESAADVLE